VALKLDLALVDRLLAGDRKAVAPFVEALTPIFQHEVGRLLYRQGRSQGRDIRQEVEEQVQELFVGLVQDDWRSCAAGDPTAGARWRTTSASMPLPADLRPALTQQTPMAGDTDRARGAGASGRHHTGG